jgi:Putative mono-oxygenase ydhR
MRIKRDWGQPDLRTPGRLAKGMTKPLHSLLLTYGLCGGATDPGGYEELTTALAPAFQAVPGLISEVWLTSRSRNRYGSFYLFASRAAFDTFVAGELFGAIWDNPGLSEPRAEDFEVAAAPTAVTGGVLIGASNVLRRELDASREDAVSPSISAATPRPRAS